MSFVWPRNVLIPRHCEVNPAYRTVSGGVALNGYERIVASDAGVWMVTYAEFPIPDRTRILRWRAMSTQFNGRLNPVAIPIYEHTRAPYPNGETYPASRLADKNNVPHSDLTPFMDKAFYSYLPFVSASTSTAFPLRATQITMTKAHAGDIEPGHRFSIGERLYQVHQVVSQNGAAATVKIWPPLREAVPAGSHCEFVEPILKVRLLSDQEMDESLDFNRWGFPTVKFIEDTL